MDQAASPDPSQHNYTSSEYQGDQQVQEYDSTQDAQQWYDSQVNEDAHQKAERLNRLRLQLERAAAREGTSTGAILERLEEYAPARAVWTEYFDEENTPFYVNEATGETRWQLPRPEELGLELALDALLCDDPKCARGVPRLVSISRGRSDRTATRRAGSRKRSSPSSRRRRPSTTSRR